MLMVTAFRLVKCLLWIWRFKTMANKAMNVAKGIGMGVLAGAAVAAVRSKVMNSGQNMRKSAGKAMHSVGNLIGDVEKMLR